LSDISDGGSVEPARVDVSSTATCDAVRKLAEEKIADVCGNTRSALPTEMDRESLES
jgi:hypothetical protein